MAGFSEAVCEKAGLARAAATRTAVAKEYRVMVKIVGGKSLRSV
jgi:hypothetical protein